MAMITTSPPATSSMAPPHPSRAKLKVTDLNPHLSCILCGGYFIDATTITECLHSFCRACIVRYLETSKYCPVCEVQIHKTRPLRCIRSDKMLQDIVYKLVPGLYQNEMKKRRELYASQPPEALKESRDAEDRGEGLEQRFIYTAEELFSLSLEYIHQESGNTENTDNTEPKRRFLRCPAAVTVSHLKKFIRLKYGIPDKYQVDLRYQEEPLQDDYSLMDVAYIFAWKRSGPLKFSYRIHERPKKLAKRIRLAGMSSPDSPDTKAHESRKSDSLLETDTSTVLPISSKTASKCSGEGKVPEVKELLSKGSEKDNPMTSFFHSSIPSAAELFSTRVETKKSSKKAAKLNSAKSRKAGTFRSSKQSSKRGSSASKKSSHSSSSTSAKHSKISVNFVGAMTNRTENSSSTPLAVVPPTKNHSSPPPLNEKKAVPPPKVPKLTIPLTPKILEAANSLQQLQQRQHQKQQHQQQQKSHHQKQQKHLQQEQHKQQHHHKQKHSPQQQQKHSPQQQQKHALTLYELEPLQKQHKHLQQDEQTEQVQCQQQKEQVQVPPQEESVQQENTVKQQREKEELNQQQEEDSLKDEQQKELLPQQQIPSQETQSQPETKEPQELPHELQQSQSHQELFQQEKETQLQQELPAATPDNNRLPQQVEEEEDKIDLDCDLFEGGPLVIAESLDVDDSADAKEHKSQIHDDDSKDETYKKTDKTEEDIDVENCEVDSGRGSDTSGRTGDDDIGSPGSSTAARTPDSEKTNPFLIPSPSSNISLPSPKLNGTSPSHSVGNVGSDFTTPPISVVSSTAITNDSGILSNSSPNHRKDDLGVLDLSTCHRKRGHEGFPLPRPRQVANPPVLDKHRQTTPCLPLPSHPSFKLLPAVLPHTSIYKKNASSDFCRGNFRCKGSTLTVYNPDPSSTRPKIVIKSVESPRASDHGHGRHHHHHSHHHSHHHQRM